MKISLLPALPLRRPVFQQMRLCCLSALLRNDPLWAKEDSVLLFLVPSTHDLRFLCCSQIVGSMNRSQPPEQRWGYLGSVLRSLRGDYVKLDSVAPIFGSGSFSDLTTAAFKHLICLLPESVFSGKSPCNYFL